MAKMNSTTALLVVLIVALVFATIYFMDPTFFGLMKAPYGAAPEGYEDVPAAVGVKGGPMNLPGAAQEKENKGNKNVAHSGSEGFADVAGFDEGSEFTAAPAGCMQKEQLTPSELLPKDMNTTWSEQAPLTGNLKMKSFLSSGALLGINTSGAKRNSNLQFRSEPPNPQQAVSIWQQSTIEPDMMRRPLDIQ